MKRWTPAKSVPLPKRWQSREEVLKAHLDSLTLDQLLHVRPDYWALRFGPASRTYDARKYDPDQPRDDYGRWVDAGGAGTANRNEVLSSTVLAARRGVSEVECDAQYKLDTFKCNLVRTPLCWELANERYAACLSGRPIHNSDFRGSQHERHVTRVEKDQRGSGHRSSSSNVLAARRQDRLVLSMGNPVAGPDALKCCAGGRRHRSAGQCTSDDRHGIVLQRRAQIRTSIMGKQMGWLRFSGPE